MDNEFEKQQPENEMPDMVESVPQNVEASAEVPQNTDTVGTVPQGNEELSKQSSNNYQQYNYQQNEQYDYGNTGYQTNYAQNSTQGQSEEDTRPLSMGEWLLTLLALCIPCCIGIALYIIWAFSKKEMSTEGISAAQL